MFRYLPKKMEICPNKVSYHRSFIQNSYKLKITWVSVNQRREERTKTNDGILSTQQMADACINMNKITDFMLNERNQVPECPLYYLSDVWFKRRWN